jgi:hypothetical protein
MQERSTGFTTFKNLILAILILGMSFTRDLETFHAALLLIVQPPNVRNSSRKR